jgi:cytosine/adenosine deaminase-related metal-dependent hydrolase
MWPRTRTRSPGRASCFPVAQPTSVYDDFGLMRERAIYAHCIHFDDDDRALMRAPGAAAAVSPTSNLFLGSGFFDYAVRDRVGLRYGLASDVGGGTSRSARFTPCWRPTTWGARARPRPA